MMFLQDSWSVLFILLVSSFSTTATVVLEKGGECNTSCNLTIVESIPENLTYPSGAPLHPSTYQAWLSLLAAASQSVDIASYYWTLLSSVNASDTTDDQGRDVFEQLGKLAGRGIKLRIVQNTPSKQFPNNDSRILAEKNLAEVQSIDFNRLVGRGILHTKLWVIDQKHFYVGSANMDWRALTQVKEFGLLGMDCECLAQDAQRLFDVYWYLSSPGASIPDPWPPQFAAMFNKDSPAKIDIGPNTGSAFWSSSPPALCAKPRTSDKDALISIINSSEKFIYIAVMDYFPSMIYEDPKMYWPLIDDALRAAAYNRGVNVSLMGSHWNHTSQDMLAFLTSLSANSGTGSGGIIQTKLFVVPPVEGKDIPYTRVNHNKYMITDKAAYVSTSNWSGDYFEFTGGVTLVVNEPEFQQQLMQVFLRDWNSQYTTDVP